MIYISVKINDMRHNISILVPFNSENICGDTIKDWKHFIGPIKAAKQKIRQVQSYTQNVESIDYFYRFTIRYNPKIDEDMRVRYSDFDYDIIHVNHIVDSNNLITQIDCKYISQGVYH